MIPIKHLILEGVDLAGKSTLYRALHKMTGFGYNIVDRSRLSRICYARLYGRSTERHEREALLEEVCDANNFFVVLMPPRDVIMSRYSQRGDEFQDVASLTRLYDIFAEEVEALLGLPNVLIVRDTREAVDTAADIASVVTLYSSMSPATLGTALREWASFGSSDEVQFRLQLDVPVDHEDVTIMNHVGESDYYHEILKTCEDVIQNEISGKNPYSKPQGLDSRRFYYASDTCISSVHFLPRDGDLKVRCVLRSTDAQRNGSPDLRFLAHLAASVPRTFKWDPKKISLEVQYNSLHIRNDLV